MRDGLKSRNPYTGEILEVVPLHSAREIDDILAKMTSPGSRRTPELGERIAALERLAEVVEGRAEELALLATREMGKPLTEARAEVKKCGTLFRHYAEHGERYLGDKELPLYGDGRASVALRPLGVVLGIMPWNYPFWQAFRFIVPTLLAGNAALLKHASNVPLCARAIEEVLHEAGVGGESFRTLFMPVDAVRGVIEDDRVAAVSLTGSEGAGRAVAAAAGGALKPVVLELGGSDPFIVLEDADVETAAAVAVKARFQNCGQSCIAAKRFIVHPDVAAEFTEAFVAAAEKLVVGDPEREDTDLGPLATPDAPRAVMEAVRDADERGAEILLRGAPAEGAQSVTPSVVSRIDGEMAVARDEVFGPVAAIRIVGSEDEILAVANETKFGLGASLWTRDEERARRLAPKIESGMVFVNLMVHSHPAVPFGGIKTSGLGRELGVEGVRAFANQQSVVLG